MDIKINMNMDMNMDMNMAMDINMDMDMNLDMKGGADLLLQQEYFTNKKCKELLIGRSN